MSSGQAARHPVKVTFLSDGITVEARTGDTLLDAALDNGIPLEHECGGNCSCTSCHVYVVTGGENLSPMEEPESYRLQFAPNRRPNSRLSCQALLLTDGVEVMVPT
jgi:2Fe-2S ferredoxin